MSTDIYFVGAGPGDPDLLTRKGEKLLNRADVVIYTGSLINPELLQLTAKHSELYDSSGMTKEELIYQMETAVQNNKLVVRLHTGDPGLYGAIQEQIDVLESKGITIEIIPGISAYQGAMAALKREFTLPGITQTVILTRLGKRTPVPEREKLRNLARHQSTMCIYLSTHILDEVISELIQGGLSEDTPIAVIYKATWPDEQVVTGTLKDIVHETKRAGITKTALIVVGNVIASSDYQDSLLYRKDFTHEFRVGDKNDQD